MARKIARNQYCRQNYSLGSTRRECSQMIYTAVLNFPKMEAAEVTLYFSCVIRVQAWTRCQMAWKIVLKALIDPVRQRALRIPVKREKAALIIECAFRCFRAWKKVRNQRVLVADREKGCHELKALFARTVDARIVDYSWFVRRQKKIRGHSARITESLCGVSRIINEKWWMRPLTISSWYAWTERKKIWNAIFELQYDDVATAEIGIV
jgi:hypothetical protein